MYLHGYILQIVDISVGVTLYYWQTQCYVPLSVRVCHLMAAHANNTHSDDCFVQN